MSKLIKCGDHKWAPMSIVCRHIIRGMADEYVRLPALPGEQDDFVCPACFALGPDGLEADDLLAVCIHCARQLTAGLAEQ